MRLNLWVFSVVAVSIISRCASHARTEHEWFKPAPSTLFSQTTLLPETSVRPVHKLKIPNASRRLQSAAAVVISSAEASDLLSLNVDAESRYLLVRGVCIGCGTGRFSVYVNADNVIVDHLSLAPRGTPPQAWPIIVELTGVPKEVFVQYSAAQ